MRYFAAFVFSFSPAEGKRQANRPGGVHREKENESGEVSHGLEDSGVNEKGGPE
jgi:hypothetical protein